MNICNNPHITMTKTMTKYLGSYLFPFVNYDIWKERIYVS